MQTITTRYNGIAKALESQALVSKPEGNEHYSCIAIWDTGATNSMITEEVAVALRLKSEGVVTIADFHGIETRPIFEVSISLSSAIHFENLEVVGAASLDDCGVLIGMDIISQLDFAITNVGGNTTHSIRFPSFEEIDFENEG